MAIFYRRVFRLVPKQRAIGLPGNFRLIPEQLMGRLVLRVDPSFLESVK